MADETVPAEAPAPAAPAPAPAPEAPAVDLANLLARVRRLEERIGIN